MAYGQVVDALDRVRWIQDNGDFNAEVDSILQDVAVDLETALEDMDAYVEDLGGLDEEDFIEQTYEVDPPAVEGAEAEDEPVMTTYTGPADE